jgi:hypothetical protein
MPLLNPGDPFPRLTISTTDALFTRVARYHGRVVDGAITPAWSR